MVREQVERGTSSPNFPNKSTAYGYETGINMISNMTNNDKLQRRNTKNSVEVNKKICFFRTDLASSY